MPNYKSNSKPSSKKHLAKKKAIFHRENAVAYSHTPVATVKLVEFGYELLRHPTFPNLKKLPDE